MNDGFEVVPYGDYNNDGKSHWTIQFTPDYDIYGVEECYFIDSTNKQELDEICNNLNNIYHKIIDYANDCYEDGHSEGYVECHDDGYYEAEIDAYNEGYDDGVDEGYNKGYNEGYEKGFSSGSECVHDQFCNQDYY